MGASTKTYRGRTLEELVPQIRNDLGDDAVIVARRESTIPGRIFSRRILEIDAAPGPSRAAAVAAPQASPPPAPEPPRQAVPLPDFTSAPPPAAQEEEKVFPESPASEPVAEPTPPIEREPVIEVRPAFPPPPPAPEPSWRPEPIVERTPEPVVERTPEPVVERTPEPIVERTPEPVVERTPEPVVERTPEPVVEAEPEPEPPARTVPEPFVRAEPAAFDRIMESVAPSTGSVTPSSGQTVEFPALQPQRDVTPTRDFELTSEAVELRDALAARGLGVRLAEEAVAGALTQLMPFEGEAGLRPLVRRALARRIPVAPLRPGGKIVAFVGPGGAGKTRCVARLCASHARAGLQPVAAIALRPDDGGAELERLLGPYGVPVHAVSSPAEAASRISSLPEATLVVLDTAGVSPRDETERQVLGGELQSIGVDEVHLAVPATMGHEASRQLVDGMSGLGVHALALTHTDETDQLGTGICLAIDTGVPISYLGTGQAVDVGLRPVMGEELAEELVPERRQAG